MIYKPFENDHKSYNGQHIDHERAQKYDKLISKLQSNQYNLKMAMNNQISIMKDSVKNSQSNIGIIKNQLKIK